MRIQTAATLILCAFAIACDTDDTGDTDLGTDIDTGTETDTEADTELADIELMGTYTSFGDTHTIDNESWEQAGSFDGVDYSSLFHILDYDNTDRFAVAQNDTDNEYNADQYSRFDWTVNADGDFVYCQSVYDGATEADARAGTADASDMDAGCNGFSWSVLEPVAE